MGFNLTILLSPTAPLLKMKYLAYPGLIGLGLIALVSFGTMVYPGQGFLWRDRLYHLSGLTLLNPLVPIANLNRHQQARIYLQGQVKQHLPLVGQCLYQLEDSTGKVWVVTDHPPPPLGQTITIWASIHYQSAPAGSQDLGDNYAQELARLSRSSP